MLLFGVPHRGMSTVDQLSAALKQSGGTGRLVLLDELNPNINAQRRYHERFVNLIDKYKYQVASFIEQLESRRLVVVWSSIPWEVIRLNTDSDSECRKKMEHGSVLGLPKRLLTTVRRFFSSLIASSNPFRFMQTIATW